MYYSFFPITVALKSPARRLFLAASLLFFSNVGWGCTLTLTEDTGSHLNVTCHGGDDGQIVLNDAVGGTGSGQQYSSDGGASWQSDTTFSGLAAGTYHMMAEDDGGCTSAIVNITITEPAVVAVTENTGSHQNVSCNGNSDGQIVLNTATGGSGSGYQYSSDGGSTWQSSPTFTGLSPGTYLMAAEDGNNCTSGNLSVTITEPAVVAVTENTGSHHNVSCNGNSDGQIVLNTATGGSGSGYQYSSDGGATWQSSPTFTGLAPGTYQMEAEDGNNCTSSSLSVTITEPAVLSFSTSHADNTSCGASGGSITVTASGGSGSYTYSDDNGASYQGGNAFSGLAAGTYAIVVKDSHGCVTSASSVTISDPTGPSLSLSVTDATCTNASNGKITATFSGSGPFQLQLDGGSFTTRTSPYQFTGLTADSHTVVVKDNHNCTASGSVTVSQPTAVTYDGTTGDITCHGGGDGFIIVTNFAGGSGTGYTASINNGTNFTATNLFAGLAAGSYQVVVKDGNGCYSETNVVTLNQPDAVVVTEDTGSHQNATCHSGDDGQIVLNTATGGSGSGYVYSANGGMTWQSDPSFSGMTAGVYQMKAKDGNGCVSANLPVTITEPAVVAVTENTGSHHNVSCNGNSDGQIVLNTATGGSGSGYQYSSDGGTTWQSSPTFTGLAPGTYQMEAEDGNNCTSSSLSVTITEPAVLSFSTSHADNISCGASGGSITVTASGGSGSYTYSDDNGVSYQGGNAFSGLAAGTYAIVVKDSHDCVTDSSSVTISDPTGPSLSLSVADATCTNASDGKITATFSGSGPFQLQLDGGSFTTRTSPYQFTGLTADSHTVVVKDSHNCTASGSVTVSQPTEVTYDGTTGDITCHGGSDGFIIVTNFAGGSGTGYTASINNGTNFAATNLFAGLAAGSYQVVVKDGNGCYSETNVVTLNQPDAVVVAEDPGSHQNVTCHGGDDGQAALSTATGGSGSGYVYSANGGMTWQSDPSFSGMTAGVYQMKAKDGNGCVSANLPVTITEPAAVAITENTGLHHNVSCHGAADGQIVLNTATGGSGSGYLYSMNGGSTWQSDPSFTGLAPGTYPMEAEDGNNCMSDNLSVTITEPTVVTVGLDSTGASKMTGESASVTATASGGSGSGYTYAWAGPNGYAASTAAMTLGSITRSMAGDYVCTATDGNGCSGSSTFVLTYVNTAPAAGPVSVRHLAGLPVRVPFSDLLGGASDVDADALAISAISAATAHGVTLALDGASASVSSMVIVPAGVTEGDTFTYTVSDGYGGSATGTVTVHVTSVAEATSALYTLTTNYPAGTAPVALCLADLRGLSVFRDLVTANSGNNTVGVRLCLDNGTFGRQDTYAVGNNPQSVCYADLNRDGWDDIATANYGDGTVSILLNQGYGANFAPATSYAVGTNSSAGPKSIAAVDVNLDGRSDLLVANYNQNSVSILTNTGGGIMSGLVNYPVGRGPVSVATGYLSTNGCPDIVTANHTDGTLSILYGHTNGTFGAAQTVSYYSGTPGPANVLVADFNRDGVPDLLVANYNSNTVSLLAGQVANGVWQVRSNVTLNVGSHPVSLLYRPGGVDFNRDGYGDLAVLCEGDQTVQVFFGDAAGNFTLQGVFPVGNDPKAIWGSNFNGDNATDFAVANAGDNTVSILLYSGPLPSSPTVNVDELAATVPLTGQTLTGDFLSYDLLTLPTNGTLSVNGVPLTDPTVLAGPVTNLMYTPATNYAGVDHLTFQVISGIPQIAPLYSFTAGSDGSIPQAGLVWGGGGLLYGCTTNGGDHGHGTVFSVSTNGAFTALHSFTEGDDGAAPCGPLVVGSDGSLYGTTSTGGSNSLNYGTLFKLAAGGTVTPLYSFTQGSDGANPLGGLCFAGDGNLYGTTSAGGDSGNGTIFKATTNGAVTPLYSFPGGSGGAMPEAGLTVGQDGSLYGTTAAGGSYNDGTIFKVTTNGVFTQLYAFTGGSDGATPLAALALGADGNLYGTASAGGTGANGVVFQVATNGLFTPLHAFAGGDDGATPLGGLIQWGNGDFYGTTSAGGTNGFGGVFRVGADGSFTPVYSFTGAADGAAPTAGLAQTGDKYLYGPAAAGGSNGLGYGTLFKLLPGSGVQTSTTGMVTFKLSTAAPKVAITAPGNNAEVTSSAINLTGTASDDASVTRVLVSLNAGDFVPANITNSTPKAAAWGLPLTLVDGTNTIQVMSLDYVSNASPVVTEKVFYRDPAVLGLATNGSGTVTPTATTSGTPTNGATLFIGRTYTVTAKAAANYTFDHWDVVAGGSTTVSDTAKLTFTMQPGLSLTANFYTNVPVITVQPRSVTVLQGVRAVFSVTAVGDGLKYQWKSNGTPIPGAIFPAYTNARPDLNGILVPTVVTYSVVVTNGGGSDTSDDVLLTVNPDTGRPSVTIVTPAANAQLTSGALSITGTAMDNVSVSQVWVSLNGGAYQSVSLTPNPTAARVSWGLPANLNVGTNRVSAYAVDFAGNLSVTSSCTCFFAVPTTVTVNIQGSGVVTATNLFDFASPTSLVSTGRLFVGRTYTLTATPARKTLSPVWDNLNDHTTVATNVYAFTVETNLTLTARFATNPPQISSQPKGVSVLQGVAASFAVTAIGDNLTYQWRAGGAPVAGAVYSVYTNPAPNLNGVDVPTLINYTVVITNGGGSVTSSVAVLTVKPDTNNPSVFIGSPAANAQLTNGSLAITGTAGDNARVSQVWVSFNGGAYQAASVTNNPAPTGVKWGVPAVSLNAGTNRVAAYAVDFAGNHSPTSSCACFYAVPTTVTVNIQGAGSVTPTNLFDVASSTSLVSTGRLFVGRSYTLTASPAANNLFSNWVNNTDSTFPAGNVYAFTVETNLTLTVNFVTNRFLAVAGTYNGLFSDTVDGVSERSAGWFTATVTPGSAKQTYSSSLYVDGNVLSGIAGQFSLDGSSPAVTVVRPGKSSLNLKLQIDFSTNHSLSGTVSNMVPGGWVSSLGGELVAANSIANPSPSVGTYNLLIPGFADPAAGPMGYGYATVQVATNAALTVANGKLADGQTFAPYTPTLSTNGNWPLYAPAYVYGYNTGTNVITSYKGMVFGWVNFSSNGTPVGELFWIKTGWTNAVYPGGFTNSSIILSSPVTNATPGGIAVPVGGLVLTNALVTLAGGDLTSNILNHINLTNLTTGATVKILAPTNYLKSLTFTPASGLVTGTFTNTADHGTLETLNGLYLPNANEIGGYFLGTNNLGGSLEVQ
jgi:uncharacterized repeat protein (TIGR03803 family)